MSLYKTVTYTHIKRLYFNKFDEKRLIIFSGRKKSYIDPLLFITDFILKVSFSLP